MTAYGIKLVWAGWASGPTIGFSNKGAQRWKDEIPAGTRMLLYETTGTAPGSKAKGTKSVIGEVEVAGTFDDGAKIRAADEAHDQVIPVRVVSGRDAGKPIPLDRVRELIGDDKWPRMGESWKPITKDQYDALLRERGG
jgi:hypothetical protein